MTLLVTGLAPLARAAETPAEAPKPAPPAIEPAKANEPVKPAEAVLALVARVPQITNPQNFPSLAERESLAKEAFQLIDSGVVKTGEEFLLISKLPLFDTTLFRAARVRYELVLAAIGLEQAGAAREVGNRWNEVISSLGRARRFSQVDKVPDMIPFDLAPPVILRVLRDSVAARAAAAEAQDNPEIKQIVEADQAPRGSRTVPQLSQGEAKKMMAEDRQRQARMREIIAAGELHSVADFARASLVMQHSGDFSGFQLAHELAVCSTLLGDRKQGRWLMAATYDRMLRTIGHDQRFGTQFVGMGGGSGVLARVDEAGINDAERVAVGCPTLEVARSRKR